MERNSGNIQQWGTGRDGLQIFDLTVKEIKIKQDKDQLRFISANSLQ